MGPVNFVDEFNAEYSRDIEPMKGGHGDAYYYQLISNVRRFKGARALPQAGPERTIKIGNNFAQWQAMQPEYRDDQFDLSDALLAIAIAMLAVTALTGLWMLYWASLVPTAFGVLMGISGLAGLPIHPDALIRLLS